MTTNSSMADSYMISASEQQFLLNHLKETRDSFINTIAPLNEDQWYKKPSAGGWSPAQCAEHIAMVESSFMTEIKKILSTEPQPEKMPEVAGKNELAIKMMLDRSTKIKGGPDEDANNKVIDKESLISNFTKHRNEVIDWVQHSSEPMKVHFTSFPGIGLIDLYQYILFISAHTERHTLQIKEVLEE